MTTACSVYIATSLDGYIARPDGGLDWLPGADGAAEGEGEDYGYAEFIASVDYLIMGRKSFEVILGFGEWSYNVPVVVLSSAAIEIPPHLADRVEWMTGAPAAIVDQLRQRGASHLYIDGGVTIQRFLQAGLISRLIIARVPILLGGGRRLFGDLAADVPLRHVETRSYPTGLVQCEYEIPAAGAIKESV